MNTVQVELTGRELRIIKSLLLDSLSSNKFSLSVRTEINKLDDDLEEYLMTMPEEK